MTIIILFVLICMIYIVFWLLEKKRASQQRELTRLRTINKLLKEEVSLN